MTVVVALIVAAGLTTMVYAVPEQRALAWGGGFGGGCGGFGGGCGGFGGGCGGFGGGCGGFAAAVAASAAAVAASAAAVAAVAASAAAVAASAARLWRLRRSAGTAGTTKQPFFIFNFRFSYKPDMPYRY